MKVKAAVARSRGETLRLEGLELDDPGPGEVLVKLIASGVAKADLDAIDGRLAMPLPFVPGGEGAGIVERVGDEVSEVAPGDAVILGFAFCGTCKPCVAGHPRLCESFASLNLSGRRLGGSAPFSTGDGEKVNGHFFGQSSFATHVICSAASALKVASGAPLEALACLGGEFLLGAGAVLEAFQLQAGDPLLVSGAGAAGLAATMVAKAQGARTIVVVDVNERRRMLASELGATIAVHTTDNLADLVKSLAADGVRFALEATGDSDARQACLASLAQGGICACVHPLADKARDFEDRLAEGSPIMRPVERHATPALIPRLVELHASGRLPLEKLIDFFPFEQVNDALEALRDESVAKPVLRFSLGGFGDLDRATSEGAMGEAPGEDTPADSVPADVPPELVKS